MHDPVDRAFVRIAEGLVHMRRVDAPGDDRNPLLMLHASPGSSRGLEPLMRALHAGGGPCLIAPDTLCNGDSAAAAPEDPGIGYFADSVVRLLDTMGISRVDLYGSHTGARIACELAATCPDRIDRVIFDGIGEYDPEMMELLVDRYAPEMAPDDYGRQFIWAFNFVRDQALHFPHFLRDPEHRLMTRSVPSAMDLHVATIEVLKGLESYHKPYRAAFRYSASIRLPFVSRPVTFLSPQGELPSLRAKAEAYVRVVHDGQLIEVGSQIEEKANIILDVLSNRQ
jgi:pimeloyl-ACP methyl ester carboxylesterase